MVQKLSHLPIFADPSQGAGRCDRVAPMKFAQLRAEQRTIAPAVGRRLA
jgi:3-deoxy-D-arabino-heptulosonate 7-phosphate (DAHP) synthase